MGAVSRATNVWGGGGGYDVTPITVLEKPKGFITKCEGQKDPRTYRQKELVSEGVGYTSNSF